VSFAGALLVAALGCAMSVSYRKHGSANGNRMRLRPLQLGAVGSKSLQIGAVRTRRRPRKPPRRADVVTRLSLLTFFHPLRGVQPCTGDARSTPGCRFEFWLPSHPFRREPGLPLDLHAIGGTSGEIGAVSAPSGFAGLGDNHRPGAGSGEAVRVAGDTVIQAS
jgi:hypothetical protein